MIPRECKRLAEVDFPIAEVSRHAVREKSIRHGHPSTLHLWWARRPLASSRAMLMALLLPDPCDPLCPETFKAKAPVILKEVRQPPTDDDETRRALIWFIGAFANWDMAAEPTYLRVARNLVRAAHGEEVPLVVDPFAGGGSIPLEALRLGCEAFASDLNPVACLILKVLLEDIPRHGPSLADELRRVGGETRDQAARELADLYPTDPDGATPIAYLWARTVRCEAPDCGAEIPLMRSFWLCRKPKRKLALRSRVERPRGEPPRVEFEIFEPKTESEVHSGTVARAKASCPCCGATLPPERVRAQLATQRGGADCVFDEQGRRTGGARMTAVVTLRPAKKGRHYRLPTNADYAAVSRAQERVAGIIAEWERRGRRGLCPVPDEEISLNEIRRISVPIYGIAKWGSLFTARQKAALVTLGATLRSQASHPHADAYAGVAAVGVDRAADYNSANCTWVSNGEFIGHTFTRQALPIVWDFAEVNPFGDATGSYNGALKWVVGVVEAVSKWSGSGGSQVGQAQQADATDQPLPDQTADIWFTDPPYYDAIPYSHLADFFFVWLKRALPNYPLLGPTDTEDGTTPKDREIVVDRPHRLSNSTKGPEFYERGMARAFAEGRRILHDDGVASVVFAHKTTEGWEALLSGMIRGGWTITGSWPVATERGSRLNARETAALATSVHLVCRPRSEDAPVGDWADVLRELPDRVADWMERLQREGIRGADLVFACVGPALEIFSRHRAVETVEGRAVDLGEYLEKVWEVVGRTALQQVLGTAEARARNGLAGALEEDARLTALFLWTVQSTEAPSENGDRLDEDAGATSRAAASGFTLPFDVVRRFAQPMGVDLDAWTGRIVAQKKGVVRLLPVTERARELFGDDGAATVAAVIERDPIGSLQQVLFPEAAGQPSSRRGRQKAGSRRGRQVRLDADPALDPAGATTLDRVHTAMLLQSSGHTAALRRLLEAEQERGPDFLRLANALSALYPRASNEKRLLDAMLLAVPR